MKAFVCVMLTAGLYLVLEYLMFENLFLGRFPMGFRIGLAFILGVSAAISLLLSDALFKGTKTSKIQLLFFRLVPAALISSILYVVNFLLLLRWANKGSVSGDWLFIIILPAFCISLLALVLISKSYGLETRHNHKGNP